MLAPALLLFVATASAEADTEAISSALQAASSALGSAARVTLSRHAGPPPTDAELAAAARAGQVTAAARLIWHDAARTRATVDAYLLPSGQLVRRELRFQPQDRPAERGRAIGLVLAALAMADPANAPSGPEPDRPAPESSLASPRPPPEPARADLQRQATTAGPPRWALEAFAGGGLALGAAGSGLGGGLGGRLQGASRWGARLGLLARAGSLAAAQASSLSVAVAAGGYRQLLPADPARTWQLSLRGELLVMYESFTHFSADDPEPVHRGRFLPGAAALLEAEWKMSAAAALHLASGLETAFGVTHVLVRGEEVATVAPLRGVLEAGVRVRF